MKRMILSVAVIWFSFASTFHGEAQQGNGQKASQSQQGAGQSAPTRKEQKWESVVPEKPGCELQSNLSTDMRWKAVPGANEYLVYWSQQPNFEKKKADSRSTRSTFMNHKERQGQYGARLPMYYRIAALKGGAESKLSDACLVDLLESNGGRVCQICGNGAIGYCSKRQIHVCSGHRVFTDDHGSSWRCP